MIINADADQLKVEVTLDVHEKHRILKQCYLADCRENYAEIPYGVLERTPNGEEKNHQRWVAVQGKKVGLAVLNNGKYSYSASDGALRITLANTSIYADHFGQQYRDDYCEYMDQGRQRFKLALVPYEGSWENVKLNRRAETLNQPMPHVVETYHEGPLPTQMEGIRLSDEGITVRAFKYSEDERGMILRVAECLGQSRKASIQLPLLKRSFQREWRPFEIKTFFLPKNLAEAEMEISSTELTEVGGA